MDIMRFNIPAFIHRLYIVSLVFAISVLNFAAWLPSINAVDCEQLQPSCSGLLTDYNQANTPLSELTIPKCFISCHPEIMSSFMVKNSDFLTLSDTYTCKCTNSSSGENQTVSTRRADSPQRPVCFSLNSPVYDLFSDPVVFWNKGNSTRPPDHLKSLSSIVLII